MIANFIKSLGILNKSKKKPPALPRILFIVKRRSLYGGYAAELSSGLWNSANFAAAMLAGAGYDAKLVEVTDNNDIDREVAAFRPDICIIEAIWVVPEKFTVLQRLHPSVTWIVRVHSEAAFLAQEGVAVKWLSEYPAFQNVYVAVNSLDAFSQLASVYAAKALSTSKLLYLPTYYPAPAKPLYEKRFHGTTINIACMGAVRPLKNNLMQAIAAIRFASTKGWRLRFHINNTRPESGGASALKNVVALFEGTGHELVLHEWMNHEAFMAFLRGIDIGMQVSFSETFCIVAADMVAAGVPIVGSPAIRWLNKKSQADPITLNDIEEALFTAIRKSGLAISNLRNLQRNAQDAKAAWLDAIRHLSP
jgi:hypothetical protein